jgi:hypothetical protein
MGASSALYFLGGLLWSLRGSGLAFTDPAWPSVEDEGFRRVAWIALALMGAVVVLLAPFAWMAWQALQLR